MAVYEQLVDYKQDDLYPYIGNQSFKTLTVDETGAITEGDTGFYNYFKKFFSNNAFDFDPNTLKISVGSAGKDSKGDRIEYRYPYGIEINNKKAQGSDDTNALKISLKFVTDTPETENERTNPRNENDTVIEIIKVPQAVKADTADIATEATTATGPKNRPAAGRAGFVYVDTAGQFNTSIPQYSANGGSVFGFDESGSPVQFPLTKDEDGKITLGGGGSVSTKLPSNNTSYYILGVESATATPQVSSLTVANASPYFRNNNLYQTSDETLKTFTQDIDVDLDKLASVKKGLFYWNTDETKTLDLGVSAQSVEALYPELVTETDGVKAVTYSKLGVVALAAIDKLNEKIKLLEAEIEELKSRL